jgi:N-acetylmuramoyl-L-alanine amidase
MKRIALVIGHGPVKDTGAGSADGKTTELEWNRKFVPMVESELSKRGVKTWLFHRIIERVPPVANVNGTNAECAIEFHLNSSTPTGTGTEMIHYAASSKGRKLAVALQESAVSVLGLKDRGVKPPFNGRGNGFLKNTNMPAVIVESFFISNPSDLATGTAKMKQLAEAYAEALAKLRF